MLESLSYGLNLNNLLEPFNDLLKAHFQNFCDLSTMFGLSVQ